MTDCHHRRMLSSGSGKNEGFLLAEAPRLSCSFLMFTNCMNSLGTVNLTVARLYSSAYAAPQGGRGLLSLLLCRMRCGMLSAFPSQRSRACSVEYLYCLPE